MIVKNKYGEYAVIVSVVDDSDLLELFPARERIGMCYVDVSTNEDIIEYEQDNYENYNEIIQKEIN